MLENCIHALGLAIGLRMIRGGQGGSDTQQSTKLFPELGDELGSAVRDDRRRETMEFPDVVNKELRSRASGAIGATWDKVTHLREAVDNDHDSVETAGSLKAGNEVDRKVDPGTIRHREGLECTMKLLTVRFGAAADVTVICPALDVANHLRPIIAAREKFIGFGATRVTGNGDIVVVMKESCAETGMVRNPKALVIIYAAVLEGAEGKSNVFVTTDILSQATQDLKDVGVRVVSLLDEGIEGSDIVGRGIVIIVLRRRVYIGIVNASGSVSIQGL